jgi:NADH-quinone oxidoreductase subunit C
MPADALTLEALKRCGGDVPASEFRGDTRIVIGKEQLLAVMQTLKDERGFDYLVDVTCVDYLQYRDANNRFGLVYQLANTATNERLTVRVYLNEPALAVKSVTPLWSGAEWLEREVYDMFGIEFEGHPDLRRILMPEEFTAFPLRKDYPLQGRGERHNFERIERAQA